MSQATTVTSSLQEMTVSPKIASQAVMAVMNTITQDKTPRPFRCRRNGSGPSTGLRAVTICVAKKLKETNLSSYDELASEVCRELDSKATPREARSVRRRAYDVINVMCAVGILRKKKKRLFSVESFLDEEMVVLLREREARLQRIRAKEQQLELLLKSKEEPVHEDFPKEELLQEAMRQAHVIPDDEQEEQPLQIVDQATVVENIQSVYSSLDDKENSGGSYLNYGGGDCCQKASLFPVLSEHGFPVIKDEMLDDDDDRYGSHMKQLTPAQIFASFY